MYWPARWINETLKTSDFKSILSADSIQVYAQKLEEVNERLENAETVVLEGQTRGKDYQLCPKCKTNISLRDGCNHIICHCLASFCFVCG